MKFVLKSHTHLQTKSDVHLTMQSLIWAMQVGDSRHVRFAGRRALDRCSVKWCPGETRAGMLSGSSPWAGAGTLGRGVGCGGGLGKAKVIPRACLEEVMPTQSGQVQAPLSTFLAGDV